MPETSCSVCEKNLILDEETICAQCELINETSKDIVPYNSVECGTCKGIVIEKTEGLYCDVCEKWYHNACSENPLPEYLHCLIKEAPNNVKWFCDKCIWETEKWIDSLKVRNKDNAENEQSDELSEIENNLKTRSRKRGRPRRLKVESDNEYDHANEPEVIIDESDSDFKGYVKRKKKTKRVKKVKTKRKVVKRRPRRKKNELECDMCSKCFLTSDDLDAHKLLHNGDDDEKPFKCTECDKSFPLKSGLKQHTLTHNKGKPFYCDICTKGFKWKSAYQRHLKAFHSDAELLPCTVEGCDFEATNQSRIEAHMLKHSEHRPYKCSKCDYAGKTVWTLEAHMATHSEERPFVCQECGKSFKKIDGLNYHTYTHTGAWPFECAVCGSKFAAESALVAHARVHTGERPYPCTMCDAKFRQKSGLNQHMKIHTGDRSVTCEVCGKLLCHEGALKTHMMIHTGEKPFRCELCGKKCRLASTLKKHMEFHSKNNFQPLERPYECEMCHNRYKSQRSLDKHKRGDRGRRPCQGENGPYYRGPVPTKTMTNEQKPELAPSFTDQVPPASRLLIKQVTTQQVPTFAPQQVPTQQIPTQQVSRKPSLKDDLKLPTEFQQANIKPKENLPQHNPQEPPPAMHSLTSVPQNYQTPPSLLYANVTNNYQQYHEMFMNASASNWAQNAKFWN